MLLLGSRWIGVVFVFFGDYLDYCWLVGIGMCSIFIVEGEVFLLLIS